MCPTACDGRAPKAVMADFMSLFVLVWNLSIAQSTMMPACSWKSKVRLGKGYVNCAGQRSASRLWVLTPPD